MKKRILMLLLVNTFLSLNAQHNNDMLVNQTLMAKIGSLCEESPEGYDDCAGLEIFLSLRFSQENLIIIEKEVSSCGDEYIVYKLDYKWKLTRKMEIKTYGKPIESSYFLDLVNLTIENGKVIGTIELLNGKIEQFLFEKNVVE